MNVPNDLVFVAHNYLMVFEVGDTKERARHAERLVAAADEVARSVGKSDMLELSKSGTTTEWSEAARTAFRMFQAFHDPATPDRYWLAAHALTFLMLLRRGRFAAPGSEADKVGGMALHLFSAQLGYEILTGRKPKLL